MVANGFCFWGLGTVMELLVKIKELPFTIMHAPMEQAFSTVLTSFNPLVPSSEFICHVVGVEE